MSAEQPVDIYQTKTQGAGSSTSTAAAEVVISNLGVVLGVNEAGNVFATRTKGRPMILDNPRKESRSRLMQKTKLARGKEDKRKRKQNLQSGKERLTPKATIKGLRQVYSTFLDIHKLWLGYMSELLNLNALVSIDGPLDAYLSSHATGMQTKLVKADFHGCKIAVKASKCPNLVGSRGIVIEETANVFRIITAEDRVKVLPKQNSIFTFAIALRPEQDTSPQIQFELHGNQFRYRAEDRASRKFKHKETVEL